MSLFTTEAVMPTCRVAKAPKISHAVLLTSAQLSRGLLRLLFVIAVARVLGPEQFGVYALLLAAVEMFAATSGSGCIDYVTREAAKDERLGWGLGAQLTWLRVAYAIPLTVIGIGILWVCRYPRLALVAIAWMSLTLIPRSLSETIQGVLRGTGRYVEFLVVELVFGLTLVAGSGLFLLWGGGLQVVIATEIAAAGAAAVAGLVFALRLRTEQRLRLNGSLLVKTSAIFNIYAFVGNLYDRLDVVLLSRLAGNYAAGVYGVAYRPINTFQLLPYGILYSLLPALSRGDWAQAEQRERLEKAMGLLLSAAFVIVLATMVFADAFVPALLGARFAESAAVLKVLIWSVILRYLNYALNMRLLTAGHERVFVVTSLVCLAVNFIGNLVFIPIFSWRAAAVLTIVTELVLLAQNMYWLRQAIGTVPRPFGWARISFVFITLMVAALVGARVVSPLAIGATCLLLFLTYLIRTGMMREFAATWRVERGTTL